MKATITLILLFLGITVIGQDKLYQEFGGYASADWGYRYMAAQNDSADVLATLANANSQDRFGLRGSFGITYIQQLNPKMRLFTGLGYSLKGYTSFNNVVVHDTTATYNPYETSFSSSDVYYHNYSYMYHYLEIPFGVGFIFPMNNNWAFIADVGGYGGIMIASKNPRCKGDTDGGNSEAAQYYGGQTTNRHSIQGTTSLMFRHRNPESKIAMEFGPELRLSLFNTYFREDYAEHKSYLYSIGFKFKVTGVFELKQQEEQEDDSSK